MYEMIVGEPPFYDEDIKVLYKNITQAKLKFPKKVSSEAKSVISSLCERVPSKRLGSKGLEEIKDHPFFSEINWDKLLKKQVKVPMRPGVNDGKVESEE